MLRNIAQCSSDQLMSISESISGQVAEAQVVEAVAATGKSFGSRMFGANFQICSCGGRN